jgi:protein-S-isoprenylcysteine O-methyltransferase Ste14
MPRHPRDRVRRRLPPPLIGALALAASVLLERVAGTGPLWGAPATWGGFVLIALGASLTLPSVALFLRRGTTVIPHGTPTALVTSGPYGITRNPMYLGIAIGLTGIALAAARPVLLAAPAVFGVAVTFLHIRAEERTLEALFGAEYLAYKARVRRWI